MPYVPLTDALKVKCRRTPFRGSLSIYAMCGSDGRVRYVGVTSKTLKQRLARHLLDPTNAAMCSWIASDRPTIHRLESVPWSEWEDAERGWIQWFRKRGELLNVDRGGMARTPSGKLRPFRAGSYAAPTGHYDVLRNTMDEFFKGRRVIR